MNFYHIFWNYKKRGSGEITFFLQVGKDLDVKLVYLSLVVKMATVKMKHLNVYVMIQIYGLGIIVMNVRH